MPIFRCDQRSSLALPESDETDTFLVLRFDEPNEWISETIENLSAFKKLSKNKIHNVRATSEWKCIYFMNLIRCKAI